jgi:serine/threonine protein kinase
MSGGHARSRIYDSSFETVQPDRSSAQDANLTAHCESHGPDQSESGDVEEDPVSGGSRRAAEEAALSLIDFSNAGQAEDGMAMDNACTPVDADTVSCEVHNAPPPTGDSEASQEPNCRAGMRVEIKCGDGQMRAGTILGSKASIVVFDAEHPMMIVDKERQDMFVPRPSDISLPHTLVSTLLSSQNDWCLHMENEFLSARSPHTNQWSLKHIESLSRIIANDKKTQHLRITDALGKGSYGFVVRSNDSNGNVFVVKAGIDCSCTPFFNRSLHRDYNFHNNPSLRPHVPELVQLTDTHPFIQLFQGPVIMSLLGMEELRHGIEEILTDSKKEWSQYKFSPDSLRILGIESFHALGVLHEHGLAHCDIKTEHLKLRYSQGGTYSIVFIDGGFSKNNTYKYQERVAASQSPIEWLGFSTAPCSPPPNAVLRVFGDGSRPGTHGFRTSTAHPARDISDLQGCDVHALAVVLLVVTGREPGPTRQDAETFEAWLYDAVSPGCFIQFSRAFPQYTADVENGGFDQTCVRWMRLMFRALNPNPSERLTAAAALSSSELLLPNFPRELIPLLESTGVVVYCSDLKPLGVFHTPECGLLFFLLLNSSDGECIANFREGHRPAGGTQHSGPDDGFLLGSFANLIQGRYVGFVGSYIQTVSAGGNVHPPDRSAWQAMHAQGQDTSEARGIPMLSKGDLPWGTILTCDCLGNAGQLSAQRDGVLSMSAEHRKAASQKYQSAVTLLRTRVLREGYTESWEPAPAVDGAGSASCGLPATGCSDSSNYGAEMDAAALDTMRILEGGWTSADYLHNFIDKQAKSQRTFLDEAACKAKGIAVFDEFPTNAADRILAQKSLREHGYFLAGGDNLMTQVANSPEFRAWYQGALFSAVCYHHEAAKGAFATQEVIFEGYDTDDDEFTPSAAGAESSVENVPAKKTRDVPPLPEPKPNDFGETPTIPGILLCIYAYIVKCNDFTPIFQCFVGPELRTDNGDEKRKQIKMIKLPEPVKEDTESEASFRRRVAGYHMLKLIMKELFYQVCNVLSDEEYAYEKDYDAEFAGVIESSSGTKPQHNHTDKEPDRLGQGASTIWNISYWWHTISCLMNSAKNIQKLVWYYREKKIGFVNAYQKVWHSVHRHTKLTDETIDLAWQCHLHHHVKDNAVDFLKMQSADLALRPVLIIVFQLDFAHGGGAYPGRVPRTLREYDEHRTGSKPRWSYRHGKFHFRLAVLIHTARKSRFGHL